MSRASCILAHPPRNLRGEEPSAVIIIDHERLVFYFQRVFPEASDYKRMMEEDRIQWAKFTVYERITGGWVPVCGSWRS